MIFRPEGFENKIYILMKGRTNMKKILALALTLVMIFVPLHPQQTTAPSTG